MKNLFESHTINNKIIKNRIAIPAMCIAIYREDGYVSDEVIEHYRSLAKGGAGLIVQEATCISPTGRLMKTQLGIWEDDQIEGLHKITDAVHNEGGIILAQIHHAGVLTVDSIIDSPSDFETVLYNGQKNTAHAMSLDRIEYVKNQFIEAGKRAFLAGYDGIELHAAHGYLLSQFLSKKINIRNDSYGSNPEQLIIDISKGIRKITNKDFIIGIRLGGYEPDIVTVIDRIKKIEPFVNYFSVSYGFDKNSSIIPSIPENFNYSPLVYAAKLIREEVGIPVFSVGGIINPTMAKDIISELNVDMVNIGRGSLVNPRWTKDAFEGKDTGKCFNCPNCAWFYDRNKCAGRIVFHKNNLN